MVVTTSTPTGNVTPDVAMPDVLSIAPTSGSNAPASSDVMMSSTNSTLITDTQPAPASASDVMTSINSTLRAAGSAYADYSCKTVSWDDVTRGTVGGALSCWGSNITDTRLYEKNGRQLFTVRSDNWNEKLGKVSADELALITGNQEPGGGDALKPITLRDFLRDMGKHGSYAGLDPSVSLSDAAADASVSIRFQTTFLPVADESLATIEFAPEMYSYQSRSASDPANLLLLATTQGVAVQANGAGATKLYHHSVEPSKTINRYWFEAERSEKKVGGAQIESHEEKLAAAQRGKATASVIGTRAMGTRFNVLMTVQPEEAATFDEDEEESDGDWSLDTSDAGFGACADLLGGMVPQAAAAPASGMRCARSSSLRAARPRVGKANAARVSRGSLVDKLDATVQIKKPVRDPSQHVTVTVVIYNTVAGGVPSMEDVKAAVDDMEALYASCGWRGTLASAGAGFMKQELTVKDTMDISEKLTSQPYVPPVAQNLVAGGDVFPASTAA